jgi:hypothetical protein
VSKRRLPGIPIERIGGVGERDAIQQALDVTRDAIRRHDERGVHGVDVAAGYRPARVPNQGGNCGLCEPKVIADTGEAVSQNMRRDAGEIGILEQLRPLPGEAPEWGAILPAGKDVVFSILLLVAARLEIFQTANDPGCVKTAPERI